MDSREQYELEQAARELAKRFIRPYVKRGDSFESLKASHMGLMRTEESVCIGGWMDGKSYTTDFIIVSRVGGQTTKIAFKIRDIFREVLGEIKSAEAIEDFHLEPG
ncbi:MAG: hypothetical protein WCS96_00525 [Victivallales bacterium]